MSLQVFLQAQLLGSEEFLSSNLSAGKTEFSGRCAWASLLCEVVPRTLLAELKLPRILLGSASAEQFLLVLAQEDIPRANDFLNRCAADITRTSGGALRLIWASTEDLGAWPIARKRLDDALHAKRFAPASDVSSIATFFAPTANGHEPEHDSYFEEFGARVASASRVGWSPDAPARLLWDAGEHAWALTDQSRTDGEAIAFPRRLAMDETGATPVSVSELASRADGAPRWGILTGDVDLFEMRLRRAVSIEEHIQLSMLLKEFFAGELSVLCTESGFWRTVTLLYRGGDNFTVLGTWDALVTLARELHRVFDSFIERNFEQFPTLEGRSISMALAIAPTTDTAITSVFRDAQRELRAAKTREPGTFHLFGHALEWKRLPEAEDLKTQLMRLIENFGYPREYVNDLASAYRESTSIPGRKRGKAAAADKPWRTYMRVSQQIPASRRRDSGNARDAVIKSLSGKAAGGVKLRPTARVGLEWARFAAGS